MQEIDLDMPCGIAVENISCFGVELTNDSKDAFGQPRWIGMNYFKG